MFTAAAAAYTFHVTTRNSLASADSRSRLHWIDLLLILRLVITDRCQDTDDTDVDEYVLGEIDEYELDYTSSSEDLFSNGTSSGTDVMNQKKENI